MLGLGMSKSRTIYMHGSIDIEAFTAFSVQMDELESLSRTKPIYIQLNSEGGTDIQGFAVSGRIQISPCPVHITCYGEANSAASIVLASGDYRSIAPDAWVMVHESFVKIKAANALAQVEAKQFERLERQWCRLFELYTGTPANTWRKLNEKTTYLSPVQALQLGVVDEILKRKEVLRAK
ncbi:MAG: ATP-dependent Clp protease proteolytic subunit [Candidatus Saccharimonadales bacterium]